MTNKPQGNPTIETPTDLPTKPIAATVEHEFFTIVTTATAMFQPEQVSFVKDDKDNWLDELPEKEREAFLGKKMKSIEATIVEAQKELNLGALKHNLHQEPFDIGAFEESTFEVQYMELLRYKDGSKYTPFCTALAKSRGVPLQSLMLKIEAKLVAHATNLGKFGRKKDALKKVTELTQIETILSS